MGTAIANLVIDPHAVFETGLFPPPNANQRYVVFRDYERDSKQVDSVLFASSRGYAFEPDFLTARLGVRKLHDQTVPGGSITDHLPALAYILQDKAARGEKLTTILLLVDVDALGGGTCTNVAINCLLPPAVTGGSRPRFWWRYLTAVQLANWRTAIGRKLAHEQNPPNPFAAVRGTDLAARVAAVVADAPPSSGNEDSPRLTPPASEALSGSGSVAEADRLLRNRWVTKRPDLDRQFAMIETFVRLCREAGVKLVVAVTPVRHSESSLQSGELEAIKARLSRMTDFWDFATPGPISDQPRLWIDEVHYVPEVGTLMMTRMFGGGPVFPGFGRFRPRTAEPKTAETRAIQSRTGQE